ncbi:MAG TPA: hypothetical protein VFE30_13045, partial [Anaeromyxobacteraceae bacterium]|nr:hypothetical protein [Anaeromyxobacteraceae bacterium]
SFQRPSLLPAEDCSPRQFLTSRRLEDDRLSSAEVGLYAAPFFRSRRRFQLFFLSNREPLNLRALLIPVKAKSTTFRR